MNNFSFVVDGAKPSLMDKTLVQTLQSFVVLPILATNLFVTTPTTDKIPTVAVPLTEENRLLNVNLLGNQQDELTIKAKKIDKYFEDKGLPLAGYGMKLATEAEKNGLPWSTLAAISMIESTGYKNACKSDKDNGFGWGSCKISFKSIDHAIEIVGLNLGGNNPNTAYHYKNKNLDGILKAYNPPSVVPNYSEKVQKVMKTIENYKVDVV